MTLENAKQTNDIKKGRYFKLKYITNGKNGTYKIVDTYARLIAYQNKKENAEPNPNIKPIKDYKYVCERTLKDGTKKTMINLHTSKSPNHHTTCLYFDINGKSITKEQYEQVNKVYGTFNEEGIYSKNLCDIISIEQKGLVIC